ncbi:alkaline phosphatase family protein [Nocardioides acrostichi]|uniref:Alkaline phosphatase family protein n=1 Tax=Nocardioides acrostichi TaxID=2784339 RepID=A0A930UVL7_9ACTN|nr:alkaline phosphatase family protein [Nocardioides acrostichi]MBF4161683.1 alkaline phosphatase family protein [Nocardioides acrostichi]
MNADTSTRRPFERGVADLRAGRRAVLTAAASGLVFSSALGAAEAAGATARSSPKRCYVIVTDGCRPDEITADLTPNLHRLRAHGMWWPRATSMPVMETIPNHVMMMTGHRPDRTGVPANSFYDRALGEVRDMDQPSDIRVGTVIERLNRQGYTTGTVLSKEYLYGVFGDRATHRWEPQPTLPITNHAPDAFTMAALRDMVTEFDPHFCFVNLGDIDRVGHADLTGTTLKVARTAALANTDRLVGQFVDDLKASGAWRHTMLLVLADHSMDWSVPTNVVSLSSGLEADDLLAGHVQIADNGGADLVYWTGPDADREAAIDRIRDIAQATDGVLKAWDRRADWLRLGPEAGEVVVFCQAGWRFSDPDPLTSNPIPGNHGHPATRAIPFFVAGGHPRVEHGARSPRHARTTDVAPTVASFFGLGTGRYEGKARI